MKKVSAAHATLLPCPSTEREPIHDCKWDKPGVIQPKHPLVILENLLPEAKLQ